MQAATQQNETTQSAVRLRGFIKGVRITNGYCFVLGDDKEVYFLHNRHLEGGTAAMIEHAVVEFTPLPKCQGEKSPRAVEAVVLAKPTSKKDQPTK